MVFGLVSAVRCPSGWRSNDEAVSHWGRRSLSSWCHGDGGWICGCSSRLGARRA
ncbi:hypothetical protein GBAR_LOCUS20284 [Geodia barretti]|uniref:Uncharacterized protein n=1 Tax=Geodia barretti TaxID=519541 RepID=A0AA35SVK9_GEOBA|nr:hypothetical protein GBAR_LOCUS20284 [Geodia barretti]